LVKMCGKLVAEEIHKIIEVLMPNSRTVLPAPKLLKLIDVRATENAITLAARTSSRVARCPACGKRGPPGFTPGTPGH
ncbi:MAG: hypothetical protein LC751_20930, partial [Actinobacteria bacterium]|nr:hypothetical protein [Actinomycetota bacterium]